MPLLTGAGGASLADYNAGVLHGAWLDATLEPDELAAAVQFMLRNSHEPDAEVRRL